MVSLTPEQREAAIERMWGAMSHDAKTEAEELADVGHALDALLENHVVLHRDDVTEECECIPRDPYDHVGVPVRKRLVTRWKRIAGA